MDIDLLDSNNLIILTLYGVNSPEEVFNSYNGADGIISWREHVKVVDIEELKSNKIQYIKQRAANELSLTDYKVLRHIGQMAINVETTLTAEEYRILEVKRQDVRDKSNVLESSVNAAKTVQQVEDII